LERSLPVIYVRGFAGPTSGIDRAVDDPFYGFNDGATHVRVDGNGEPAFYQFEGPLVRLITDEDYKVLVYGNQEAFLKASPDDSLTPGSLWIYRFYDSAADTFGKSGHPYRLLDAAESLLEFVRLVRDKTAGHPKVWLVAHSMGGLICRSMIQKVCPDNGIGAGDLIDKLFTYATPHNGIEFSIAGINIAVPEIAPFGAEIFNRERMYAYLTPAAQLSTAPKPPRGQDGSMAWDAHVIPKAVFSTNRVFCIVGTNAADYGLVSKAVGPKSDGLVQIDNAYVRNAHRAFIHRSHSGAYGEVNSEEGYQNLRRFLFGSRQVKVELCGLRLPDSPPHQDKEITDIWQGEIRVSIRGLPVVINEQLAADYCPIQLNLEEGRIPPDSPDTPVPLTTVFLLDARHDAGRRNGQGQQVSPRCRYSLQLRTIHLQERNGTFFWQHHLETTADWEDTLLVDVGPGDHDPPGTERVWAAWNSTTTTTNSSSDPIAAEPLPTVPLRASDPPDAIAFAIDLPAAGRAILGANAVIRLTATPWS
jgi:pimeloyl-ACP methyl ester carboxylesterase